MKEKQLMGSGHTLSVIEKEGKLIAYRGEVGFRGVSIYDGPDIESLSLIKQMMPRYRWPTAVVYDGEVHLYYTANVGEEGTYDKQVIYHAVGDGYTFDEKGILIGSAPFPFVNDGELCLYFHRFINGMHEIVHMKNGHQNIVLMKKSPAALSAPSVMKVGKMWTLLCEYRESQNPWRTICYEGPSAMGPWEYAFDFMDDWRACAFQHRIQGKYVVTYSHRVNGQWGLYYREIP